MKRKNTDINRKREQEKEMVTQMIQLYCSGNHHTGSLMCSECQKLAEYASMRSDKCPFMETKTFCSNCKVHCYKPDMRDKIKAVMRYSGPRMILHHPVAAVRHLILTKREKRQLDKKWCWMYQGDSAIKYKHIIMLCLLICACKCYKNVFYL